MKITEDNFFYATFLLTSLLYQPYIPCALDNLIRTNERCQNFQKSVNKIFKTVMNTVALCLEQTNQNDIFRLPYIFIFDIIRNKDVHFYLTLE